MARKNRVKPPGSSSPAPAPAPAPNRPNNRPHRRPNRQAIKQRMAARVGGGTTTTGEEAGGMSDLMAKQDPESDFFGHLTGAGINPFGSTGYANWLQNEAFGQTQAHYGMALQQNPNLTSPEFYRQLFADPRASQAFGVDAYRPHHIQENPRDYYTLMMQNSGLRPGGSSPWERWLRDEGWNLAADQYGADHVRNPQTMFGGWLTPSFFGGS